MVQLLSTLQSLKKPYIFPHIEQKLREVQKKTPHMSILNFGVGDVALPLCPTIAQALTSAAHEMQTDGGKRGYGPGCGYRFLREKIADVVFADYGIAADEIFISDGINRDITELQELFPSDVHVAVPDPAYPAYLHMSLVTGRKNVHLLVCTEEHGFHPIPPQEHCDLIYLCSPNNPTGVAMDEHALQAWIDYARTHEALILFDAAYAAFIRSPGVPKHVYDLAGAKECVVSFYSFSKSAGFTGLRCGYTVIPKELKVREGRERVALAPLWEQRQEIKCNGIAYPIQRAAEAALTPQGQSEARAQIDAYAGCAQCLARGLQHLGYTCWGGEDSPYVWWKTEGRSSWDFFAQLLEQRGILSIPGTGFGTHGEGYVRLSGFNSQAHAEEALSRLCTN